MRRRFGVTYHPSQIRRTLHTVGFSIQYPKQRLSMADKALQALWIRQELPAIKKARRERGVLMYEDEVLFRQSGSISRHWTRRGLGSQVKSFPGRTSIKAIGAVPIDKQPKFHFRFVDRFNSTTYLKFLTQRVRQYKGRRIHLIADNTRWHKSRVVMKWAETNPDKIELHFLLKYSPNFHAVEWAWKETRRWATHNRFFPTAAILKQKLFRRFSRYQGNPASLRSLVAPFL